jgi:hypothetical protein
MPSQYGQKIDQQRCHSISLAAQTQAGDNGFNMGRQNAHAGAKFAAFVVRIGAAQKRA